MRAVNALTLRQSLGKVLRQLAKGGAPVLVEQRGRPAAALISIDDYEKRFVDRTADDKRRQVVARIRELKFESKPGRTTLDMLRDLRE
jgi:prevent-host-death family protein